MDTTRDTEATPAIGDAPGELRTLRMVTRFGSVAEFEQAFARLVDETSLFVVTRRLFAVGDRLRFVIQLQDRETVVMSGEGDIVESPARLPGSDTGVGMRLRLTKLGAASMLLHRRLLKMRREREAVPRRVPPPPPRTSTSRPTPDPSGPTVSASPTSGTPLVSRETAILGSTFRLPANPLGELADGTLEAFVECVLYEHGEPGTPTMDETADPVSPIPASGSGAMRAPSEPWAARADGGVTAAGTHPDLPAAAPALAPPAAAAAPLPLVRVTVGMGAQLLTAMLAMGLGLLGGYVLFGHPARGEASSIRVTESDPRPTVPAPVNDEVAAAELSPDEPGAAAGEPAAALPVVAATGDTVAPPVPSAALAPMPPPASAVTGCTASIETLPAGARVKLDGRDMGESPLADLEVPCGQEVTVAIEHPRYRKVEQRLIVQSGAAPGQVEVRLVRPAAHVRLVSTPPGAVITVDGKVIGRAPVDTAASAFTTMYVTATLNGYKVWARRVSVSGTEVTIQPRLEAVPGTR
jgi:hypothetical protein